MPTKEIELPKEMTYQQLFIRFERKENQGTIIVLNDYNYFDEFYNATNDKSEFDKACNNYLHSDHYKEKLKEFRNR